MRKTAAVAWKEVRSYFSSPMAYAVAGVFVGLTGYFFVDGLSGPIPEATVRPYTDSATFVLVLLAPLLTMRLLAEEHKLGTSELLLTAPIRDWEVALGKFLASLFFFVASIALTLFYVALLYWVGNPDTGPILTAYLGLVLFAGAALSIGLFTSSITDNQIVAAVLAAGALLMLTVIQLAADQTSGVIATVLSEVSMAEHYGDFSRGILSLRGVVYYVSVIVVFLFLTVRSLESRRWR